MSDAKVGFLDGDSFRFTCPNGNRCGPLLIKELSHLAHDPQGKKGYPQWSWDGNKEQPTFSPSINCHGCWHGFIVKGKCQDNPA